MDRKSLDTCLTADCNSLDVCINVDRKSLDACLTEYHTSLDASLTVDCKYVVTMLPVSLLWYRQQSSKFNSTK